MGTSRERPVMGRGRWLIVAVVVALCSCATVPKQAFNKAANTDVKVVAIIEPPANDEYAVVNINHVGNSFGLIGGLVALADIQKKTKTFTEAVRADGFDVVADFKRELIRELEARNYRVKVITPPREGKKFLQKYEGLDAEADAYIDIVVGAGYMCNGASADYLPSVSASVRVIKRRSAEVIYQEIVVYGFELAYGKPVMVASDGRFRFKDYDALMASLPQAIDGMRAGVPAVVTQLSRDLSQ